MAHIFSDRVKEASLTEGTGSYNLAGTVDTFQTFNTALSIGDTCFYVAEDGSDWEVGTGTLLTAATLQRTTIHDSSNGGASVNWLAGTKTLALTAAAEYFRERSYTDTVIDGLFGSHTHVEDDVTDLDKYTQNEVDTRVIDGGYF